MAVFVNYYPCSYGDSLVKMFSGQPLSRDNGVVSNTSLFKKLNFYNMPADQKQSMLCRLAANQVVSCHRQGSFDFGSSHRVISVELDLLDFLAPRMQKIHIGAYKLIGPLANNPRLTWDQKIFADYHYWKRNNILPSDVILPITTVIDKKKLADFCQAQDLIFDKEWADDIKQDFDQYDCMS